MDLLRRLASAALGEASSLRAALPPRYAPSPVETAEAETPALDAPPRAAELPLAPARPAEARPAPRPAAEAAPAAPAAWRERSGAATGEGPPAVPLLHHPPSQVSAQALRDAGRETPRTAESATPVGDGRRPEPAASPGPAPARRSRPEPEWPAAPLEPSLVALAAASPPAEARGPVIQVTIERIEVRAPAASPPRSDEPARRRPEPVRSLSAYLRGGSR